MTRYKYKKQQIKAIYAQENQAREIYCEYLENNIEEEDRFIRVLNTIMETGGLQIGTGNYIEGSFANNDCHCTLEEISRELGVTRERVRHIEQKALRKLKHPRMSRLLRGFVYSIEDERLEVGKKKVTYATENHEPDGADVDHLKKLKSLGVFY